jgi:hypothetical protein
MKRKLNFMANLLLTAAFAAVFASRNRFVPRASRRRLGVPRPGVPLRIP